MSVDPENPPSLKIEKLFSFGPTPQGCEVSCDLILGFPRPCPEVAVWVSNRSSIFLRRPMKTVSSKQMTSGTICVSLVHCPAHSSLEDGWQRIRLTLHAPNAAEYWIAPIETVSESETGFERVYQGSADSCHLASRFCFRTILLLSLLCRLETF